MKWEEIDISQVAAAISGNVSFGRSSKISGVSTDTRSIRSGDIFFAIEGDRFDGHSFVKEASDKGASCVVVHKDIALKGIPAIKVKNTTESFGDFASWWRKHHSAKVIAITGSTGKTTVKEMTALILSHAGTTLKTEGNFNNNIGLPHTLFNLTDKHQFAVVEMGISKHGEISRLVQIADPDIGLITNIGEAHLEGLGNIQAVAEAKWELAEYLFGKGALLLINGDNELLRSLADKRKKYGRAIPFGLGKDNTIKAENIVNHPDGSKFIIIYDGKSFPVNLKVTGDFFIIDALGAISIGISCGIPMETNIKAIEKFTPVKGRFYVTKGPYDSLLIDDTYNANPTSLEAGLKAASDMRRNNNRLIVVLGDMLELGQESIALHKKAGQLIADIKTDLLITLGSYSEYVSYGAKDKGLTNTVGFADHNEIADYLLANIHQGDIVFVKGSRGMGMEKVLDKLRNYN